MERRFKWFFVLVNPIYMELTSMQAEREIPALYRMAGLRAGHYRFCYRRTFRDVSYED